MNPIGIIFTGGPLSAFADFAYKIDENVFKLGIPILGICYGMQITTQTLGGEVCPAPVGEYGKVEVEYKEHILFDGVKKKNIVWMSHQDYVKKLGKGFVSIASSSSTPNAAMANDKKKIYGLQFHPEVVHTNQGLKIMQNFIYKICGAKGNWTMGSFVKTQIEQLREKLAGKKFFLHFLVVLTARFVQHCFKKLVQKDLFVFLLTMAFLENLKEKKLKEFLRTSLILI